MHLRTLLLLPIVLAASFATTALADPAGQLRDLDQQLKDGRISQAEYDRRWKDVISRGMSTAAAPAPTPAPSVPKLDFKRPEPPRPKNEISISGGAGVLDIGNSSDVLYTATAMYGRFITENVQVSLGAQYDRATVEDASVSGLTGLGAIDFHFNPTAKFVPFVGVGAGYGRMQIEDESDYDWSWHVHIGLKQTIRPDTAIRYEIRYFDHIDFDIQGAAATIGVSWMF